MVGFHAVVSSVGGWDSGGELWAGLGGYVAFEYQFRQDETRRGKEGSDFMKIGKRGGKGARGREG